MSYSIWTTKSKSSSNIFSSFKSNHGNNAYAFKEKANPTYRETAPNYQQPTKFSENLVIQTTPALLICIASFSPGMNNLVRISAFVFGGK